MKLSGHVQMLGFYVIGYYMAARGYEISLLLFSTQEEKFRISKWPCNVLFIIIINTNEIQNHFTLILSFLVWKARFIMKP